MSTLDDYLNKIRIRIKEKDTQFFSDPDLLSLANDVVLRFYERMRKQNCLRIITCDDLAIVSGTQSYPISGKEGIVSLGVTTEGYETIPRYREDYPDVFSYRETTTGIDFFNHADQTVYLKYWETKPSIASTDATLPWDGEWDQALFWAIIVECRIIRERPFQAEAFYATQEEEDALQNAIEKYGTLTYMMRSNYV